MAAMKYSVLVLAAAMVGGCASNATTKSAGADNPQMDLGAPAGGVAAVAPTASYVPPDPQPVMADPTPVAAIPVIASAAQPAAAIGRTYTVRKGDTLYRIARERYGSGKEWRKIAMANPGLTPQTLRVGQRLVIPQ
ncbi:MAG TPA: LysM domain-containing protein [Tepidisphaeraceae bacterium]|nr:LysM domain-containing protein [Tepidisphaeraceae bacterium]